MRTDAKGEEGEASGAEGIVALGCSNGEDKRIVDTAESAAFVLEDGITDKFDEPGAVFVATTGFMKLRGDDPGVGLGGVRDDAGVNTASGAEVDAEVSAFRGRVGCYLMVRVGDELANGAVGKGFEVGGGGGLKAQVEIRMGVDVNGPIEIVKGAEEEDE